MGIGLVLAIGLSFKQAKLLKEIAMTTQTFGFVQTQKPAITLERLLAILFAVELREELDRGTHGDKSYAPYVWGL